MNRSITIEKLDQMPIENRQIEIVERKGRGHPDYIADGASESVSKALSTYYLKTFGTLLHHNVDKGLVVGGKSRPFFGGGEVNEPIQIIVAGRAVTQVVKKGRIIPIPIGSITLGAIKKFLRENFRYLNIDLHVIVNYMIKPGSLDLVKTFDTNQKMPLANDTSFGVSYAPLSQTEKLTLETELYLNSSLLKKKMPELGEDIKVMGLRKNAHIDLTIAVPLISNLTPDLDNYISVKEEVKNRVADLATKITKLPVDVHANTADNYDNGIFYLTVTGTSAEHGDDGNTGRGNRIHGLITPCRPMSLEATAGKNPVSHVGKIYNILAKTIANKIYNKIDGVTEVYIKLLSQIGKPIDQPMIANVEALLEKGTKLNTVKGDIKCVVNESFTNIKQVTNDILEDRTLLF
ncbi:MAG: methionine adenosyltransferase [Candidatus Bathyarchaeota archaeon]|nr:MAG: methionine adenosyltransferase [Candidatus Bathyarchaeota archaeon]